MRIEIVFHDKGPSKTRDVNEFFSVMWRALRYTAKGVALSFGHKISMRRF